MSAEGRIVGNYTLGPLIGRGGMSEVYAAEHRFLGDAVAIKLLRADLATDDVAADAFVAEAARTRAIHHPNVVRVLDFGRDDETHGCYLVLERVAGGTLATRLSRSGRLDEHEVRRLGAAIAEGMHAAHASGIVHRDLKPGNVMLAGDDPKIVDFGIAKYLGNQSAVTTGRRVGTPAYMAPEQLTGGLIAPCVDIWALGVILFEAATGRLPFENFADGRCPQLFETAPRASTLAAVSPALDDLVLRCLERDPGRRPASMDAVARVLRGEDSDERITQEVGGPPIAPALAKPARRVWPFAIGGAGALAAIVAAVVMFGSSDSNGSSAPVSPVPSPAAPPVVAPVEPPPRPVESPPAPPPPAAAEIEVRSTPAGAAIFVDGKRRGVTPARLAVIVPASIELRRRGYRRARVRAERAGVIALELVRARRRPAGKQKPTRETLD